MKTKAILTSLALLLGAGSAFAQSSKAIELSLGVKALSYPRLSIRSAERSPQGYHLALEKRELIFGLNATISKELSSHWAVLFGQSLFKEGGIISHSNLQLEHRLGAYFSRSAYIDPYLALGIGYLYNNTSRKASIQGSIEGKPIIGQEQGCSLWQHKHSLPLSLSAGVRLWLNDRWGLDLKADYMALASTPQAAEWSATFGLSYRIGGRSKAPQAEVQYIERWYEQVVEKPIIIEKQVPVYISEVLEGIYFDFGSSRLSKASMPLVERLAQWMRQDTSRRFLITGCADALGSESYNEKLSLARAKALREALLSQGVSQERIKCRGVGKRIALAPPSANTDTRSQDRKILLEVVDSDDYWKRIE